LVFQRHDTPNENASTTPSVICGEAALCHQGFTRASGGPFGNLFWRQEPYRA
jgi:hypothetical protein